MTNKLAISLNMVVCDEEINLRRILPLYRTKFEDIAIVVQESTDNTLELAREFADTVIERPKVGYCEGDRKLACDSSRSEWIVILDGDEQITEEGFENLPTVFSGEADAYHYWMYDFNNKPRFMKSCRIGKRDTLIYQDKLHTVIQSTGTVGVFPGVFNRHLKDEEQRRRKNEEQAKFVLEHPEKVSENWLRSNNK